MAEVGLSVRRPVAVFGGRDVGYGVGEVGPRARGLAGPFSGPDGYKKAARLAELWNEMSDEQWALAEALFVALDSYDPFEIDAPNLNAWPAPGVRREFAIWLVSRAGTVGAGDEHASRERSEK